LDTIAVARRLKEIGRYFEYGDDEGDCMPMNGIGLNGINAIFFENY
jgi:hypothetical protein